MPVKEKSATRAPAVQACERSTFTRGSGWENLQTMRNSTDRRTPAGSYFFGPDASPASFPVAQTVALDAAYRSAGHGGTGGDWYDAFDLGDGRIGVSVGDVAGRGMDTAVAMGQARRAIRMAAAAIKSPSELLNNANDVLPLEETVVMATAIAGFYDVASRTFQYACAGHPPPIMVAGGRTHVLPGGGLPLGLSLDIASPDWMVTLPPGASMYFYTDGLLEYDRDIIAGERRLVEAIAETAATRPRNAASALHDAIFAGIDNTDDAATLVMRARGGPVDRMSLAYSSTPQFARISRSVLRDFLAWRRVGETAATAILYAAGEAVANAIEHGGRQAGDTFRIDLDANDERLHVVVESTGDWKAFVPRIERGRGMSIMQALATQVHVTSTQDATSVHLTFALAPTPDAEFEVVT
jgi:anti-sigma regulatory factor (Ser/Thr protein kinase)